MIGQILKRYRLKIILCFLLNIVSAVCGIAIMKIIAAEINSLESGVQDSVYSFQLFMVAIAAVMLFGFLSSFLLQKFTEMMAFELRTTMVRRFLLTPYQRIQQLGGHRVFSTMTHDIGTISNGLSMLSGFIHSSVTVLLCIAYLFLTSWKLSLVVTGFLLLAVGIAGVFTRIGSRYQRALRNNHDSFYNGLKALVDGRKELSSNSKRKYFFFNQIIDPVCRDMRKNETRTSLVYTFLGSWTTAQVFCLIAVVVYGGKFIVEDITQMVAVTFVIVILYMIEPIIQLVSFLEDVAHYRISYFRIKNLDLAEDLDFSRLKDNHQSTPWTQLSFNQIEYEYEKSEENDYSFHMGPVSLTFERGDIVFLTGGNGSGKTTFAKLMVGLYEKSSGEISIDGKIVGVDGISMQEYRTMFSTIFSDFYVFEHVLNKSGELADDDLIDDFIEKMKLQKVVGTKNGVLSSVDLSHGQRKRLALLTSYFENADICVFDEWAADQDPLFRTHFYTHLLPELKALGKTVFVISHDDRYFDIADHLIKFELGRIASDVKLDGDIQARVSKLRQIEELVA